MNPLEEVGSGRLWPRLKTWGNDLVELLLPSACGGCGREGALFCGSCRSATAILEEPRCLRCDAPVIGGARCGLCVRHPLRELDGLRVDYVYAGPLRRAIIAFKYRSLNALAAPLGDLLVSVWRRRPLPADLVVPIPLHPRRQRSRGFNQAALLAGELVTASPIPLADALSRLRDTPPQALAADAGARQAQVAGAFRADGSVGGKRVLLVDDVCTTGATLEAAAKACREAGAAAVWGLVLARVL